MIEKPKRPKKPDIQERQPPRTLQELISRYDLDNTKIYDFLDGLVELINTDINNLNNQKVNKVINITSTGTNLNDYKTEGTYYFSPSYTPTNIPVGVNGWLKVIPGNDGTVIVKQIWYRHGTPNSNDYETYVRTFSSNTWSNWNKLAIQSSIDNLNNNKVSKTGDTLTGELNFNNKNDYAAIRKTRTINGIDYNVNIGVGANQSGRMELQDANNNVLGSVEARSSGIYNGLTGKKLAEQSTGWINATLSSYITGTVRYIKIGNIVIVNFSDVQVKSNLSHQVVLASGLPTSTNYQMTLLHNFDDQTKQPIRLAINTSGQIVDHYSSNTTSNNNYYGTLIYVTNQ